MTPSRRARTLLASVAAGLWSCSEPTMFFEADDPAPSAPVSTPQTEASFRACDPNLRIDEGGCSALIIEDFVEDTQGERTPALFVVDGETGYTAHLLDLAGTFPAAGQVAVSPSGSEIAYVTYEAGWQLYRMDLWTQEPVHVTTLVGGTLPGQPTWSVDGAIAFVTYDVRASAWQLAIAEDDTTRTIDTFTTPPAGITNVRPAFSWDGTAIVYAAYEGEGGVLRMADLATGAVDTVFDPPGTGAVRHPEFDFTSERIVFSYFDDTALAWILARLDVRTRAIEELAVLAPDADAQARVAPFDERVVHLDDRNAMTGREITLTLLGEEEPRVLDVVGPHFRAGHPAWAPDGSRVAYVRVADEGAELTLVRVVDGEREVLRTQVAPATVGRPQWLGRRWSPDALE